MDGCFLDAYCAPCSRLVANMVLPMLIGRICNRRIVDPSLHTPVLLRST